jgi:hypothetical protein
MESGSWLHVSNFMYLMLQGFLQILSDHWCVSYELLARHKHRGLYCRLFSLLDLEIRLTAGVTVRQGVCAPPMHLVPPLVYPRVCISPISRFALTIGFWRLVIFIVLILFITHNMHSFYQLFAVISETS